jgi:hypothetical protein
MADELYVQVLGIHVEDSLVCIPGVFENPHNCSGHSHIPGTRSLRVDVVAICGGDGDEAAWRALLGQTVRLDAAQNAG